MINADPKILARRCVGYLESIMRYTFSGLVFGAMLLGNQIAYSQNLTGPQMNAIRSAKDYLSMMAFSRDGLIEQLSSSYGDGYDFSDATVAVDSLQVDWNAQAKRSAEQYLSMMGFSCAGLIEQLSSASGDKYTQSQAAYGAQKVGAC